MTRSIWSLCELLIKGCAWLCWFQCADVHESPGRDSDQDRRRSQRGQFFLQLLPSLDSLSFSTCLLSSWMLNSLNFFPTKVDSLWNTGSHLIGCEPENVLRIKSNRIGTEADVLFSFSECFMNGTAAGVATVSYRRPSRGAAPAHRLRFLFDFD